MRIQLFSAALMRYVGFICLSVTLLAHPAHGQGTYTAASCSRSDVGAVISGPTHTAVNGDIIIIPAGTCTWTSPITVNGIGIDITGTGTPNTGGGTFGAGTANTTIIDNASGPLFIFENLAPGETAEVELLNLEAQTGLAANSLLPGPISLQGNCTVSGCANVRVDNINFLTGWGVVAGDGAMIVEDGVFGVADHNTASESSFPTGGAGPPFVDTNNSAWQGIGSYGDNSFAAPDTLGTAQQFFIENNSINGIRVTDNDVGPVNGGFGGNRVTCRFNVITNMNGSGVCTFHGTAWTRLRGQRQLEAYYNQINCPTGTPCNVGFGVDSGTGYIFSNSYIATGSGSGFNFSVAITLYRTEGLGQSPWFQCNGTQTWDQIPFTNTSQCIDQPGTGAGLLMQGTIPVLASNPACLGAGGCWLQNAKDPIYEAGDTGAHLNAIATVSDPTRLAGYYYVAVSKSAQSSPTAPFNGTTGTGYGSLANRPPTCTIGVGYWATDQGSWNTYSNSQEGQLFTCTATNTWTLKYTPYAYPHPLVTGGTTASNPPNPPTGLTATVE